MFNAAAKILLKFFALATIVSWVPGWLMVFTAAGWLREVCLVLFGIGPAVAAMILNRMDGGAMLLRKFVVLPLEVRHIAFSLLVPSGMLVATSIISELIKEVHPIGVPKFDIPEVLTAMLFAIVANPWEEIAWRGYLLERLQPKIGQIGSSAAIGAIAGVWHLPLFNVEGSLMSGYPYVYWFTGTLAISFVATMLFNSSGGSLLITSLFHVSINSQCAAFGITSFRAYSIVSILIITVCVVLMIRRNSVATTAMREEGQTVKNSG